jgi:ring-1,2-phenylacetyl-CoA epoxidase subunit PaaE
MTTTTDPGVEFHPLTVTDVSRLTDEAVAVTFDVPPELRDDYRHVAGQHLILRATIDGRDVRRSYSICSPAGSDRLQVGIKHLPGGAFSTWANTELAPGTVIEATKPAGEFVHRPRRDTGGSYAAIAAGSGITPVLSIIATTLRDEPESRFTLIFGNREGRSVMFLDEIDAVKGAYPDRFMVMHILSRESHAVPLLEGRIDADKLDDLFSTVVEPDDVDTWYLCGPRGLVETAREVLTARGVDPGLVHDELFYAGDVIAPVAPVEESTGATVRFTLDGRTSTVMVDPDGAPILDHVLSVRPEGPFSCRSGACASCRAQVTEGEVRMDRNWSLNNAEVAAGQILTCQSHPVSDVVELTYDV